MFSVKLCTRKLEFDKGELSANKKAVVETKQVKKKVKNEHGGDVTNGDEEEEDMVPIGENIFVRKYVLTQASSSAPNAFVKILAEEVWTPHILANRQVKGRSNCDRHPASPDKLEAVKKQFKKYLESKGYRDSALGIEFNKFNTHFGNAVSSAMSKLGIKKVDRKRGANNDGSNNDPNKKPKLNSADKRSDDDYNDSNDIKY